MSDNYAGGIYGYYKTNGFWMHIENFGPKSEEFTSAYSMIPSGSLFGYSVVSAVNMSADGFQLFNAVSFPGNGE
jgi:hypothetical protein